MSYFDIKLKPIKFRYSNADYNMEKETNSIYKGVGAIKYCNADMSNKLYEFRDQKFDSFLDLLDVFPGNSRQLSILISLGYFSEFGGTKKLLAMSLFYDMYHGKKILKKDKTTLPIDLIQKHMVSETEKQYRFTPEAMSALLRDYCSQLPDEDMPLRNRLDAEAEYLGYISYTNPDLEKNVGFVINIDTKYSPKITMYMLATGQTIVYKLPKKSYEHNPFNKGDILQFHTEERQKSRKTENGWEKLNEYEIWMTSYIILQNI
jgi:DNA polymerase III alpha subunit